MRHLIHLQELHQSNGTHTRSKRSISNLRNFGLHSLMLSQSSLISSSNVFLTCSTQTLFEKRHSDLCQSSNAFWRKPAFWFSGELDLNSLQNDQDFPDTTKRISCNLESSFVTIFPIKILQPATWNFEAFFIRINLRRNLIFHYFEKVHQICLFQRTIVLIEASLSEPTHCIFEVWIFGL